MIQKLWNFLFPKDREIELLIEQKRIEHEAKIEALNKMEELRRQLIQAEIDAEDAAYVADLERQKRAFLRANPEFDEATASIMFMPVSCKRQVAIVRYV